MEFFISIWLFASIVVVLNIYRLSRFSKFMQREIDRVFEQRINGNRNAQYPNITASYNNLKWYDSFNYKFERLVVYDDSAY